MQKESDAFEAGFEDNQQILQRWLRGESDLGIEGKACFLQSVGCMAPGFRVEGEGLSSFSG